ncbi:multidrug resistance protein [Aspergillus heteromorphus CBS 117.55]|uniref:Multidrug resistance protein n=1 Tax=Aspergillus heteromorphus CBS 117.55 TaxID=1448321 RepID=A0A317VDQ3_9EURO|nr:multidrug resistance protein [Aspergillus heteromorphus CBS 117.55]PWY71032.1 multidrug resistance protein [Aspergillus heteromorphus CBS 117.55]
MESKTITTPSSEPRTPQPTHNDHTKAILQRQTDGLPASSQAKQTVFAYATPFDILLITLSTLSAILAGALNPLLTVIYGLLVHSFQDHANGTSTTSHLSSSISRFSLYYVYLGIAEFILIYIATVGFYHSGERITRALRRAYLQAIVRQNISFFDTLSAGEVTARITSDMNVIQEGITSKLIEYWRLALILISTAVLLGGIEFVGSLYAVRYSRRMGAALGRGSAVAEEALGSIRHVAAFGIQRGMEERYVRHLDTAETWGFKMRLAISLMIGAINAVPYLSYGLAFWQGSRYIVDGAMSASAVVTTTMATIIGAFAVGRIAPSAESFISSIGHAGTILDAIARQSPLDPLSTEGRVLEEVEGDIALENVSLVYPSRQDVDVLKAITLRLPANKTTALVGASGCGKSSIVGLVERFYEPTGGRITLDGHDVADLNLSWLRRQMSYVVQEPVLFNRSIYENVLLGLDETMVSLSGAEKDKLVHDAAKTANAHEFITGLPQGYQTQVGAKGLQLSGGQRQRICIARAVISNPKILLLDEATSALDVKSERVVQLALESAAKNRTTVVIAHRLSTVRKADNIIVLADGCVLEEGGHQELIAQGGAYSRLVEAQQVAAEAETDISNPKQDDLVTVKVKSNLVKVSESPEVNDTSDDPPEKVEAVIAAEARPTFRTYFQVVGKLNQKEVPIIIAGLLLCIIAGCIIPVQAVFFAESITTISLPASEYPKLRHNIDFWCLMFLMIAIVTFIAWVGQGICFSYSTERLTHKARHQSFRSILRLDVSYFDQKNHSSGAFTASLANTARELTGLSGAIIGAALTFTTTLAAGIIMSLAIGWKLALVCTATIPILVGTGYIRLRILALFDGKVRKTHEEAATYASEVVSSIRAVASLTLEKHVLSEYTNILAKEVAKSLRSILKASTLYAASQSFGFFCAALVFWYGGTLLDSNEYTTLQFYICFVALVSGSQIAGAIFNYAPDMSKALHAGRDLKALFELTPTIDTWREGTGQVDAQAVGRIDISDVSFRYPTRSERLVLEKVDIQIQPGQFVALVGASGSGKSTVIQLLERFYDPTNGRILVDGRDISELNVNEYRRMVSLVSQEPTLYDGSIRDNLLLGVERLVDDVQLVQACREANIYDFVSSLPDGFNTPIGTSGTMLSGGQKQRLAIARALLRKTQILLLDEATSALDSESEKVVQEALDRASSQRTTIAVAHRLSTIQHADLDLCH